MLHIYHIPAFPTSNDVVSSKIRLRGHQLEQGQLSDERGVAENSAGGSLEHLGGALAAQQTRPVEEGEQVAVRQLEQPELFADQRTGLAAELYSVAALPVSLGHALVQDLGSAGRAEGVEAVTYLPQIEMENKVGVGVDQDNLKHALLLCGLHSCHSPELLPAVVRRSNHHLRKVHHEARWRVWEPLKHVGGGSVLNGEEPPGERQVQHRKGLLLGLSGRRAEAELAPEPELAFGPQGGLRDHLPLVVLALGGFRGEGGAEDPPAALESEVKPVSGTAEP